MTLEADAAPENRDYVNSLARGLEVIRAFTRAKPAMTLSEVAERTAINRAAARRFLLTLVREGYAETDGKYFRLKPKVLELGYSVLASMDVGEVVQPVLDALAEKVQESCFAVVLDGDAAIYIARATARRIVHVGISVGVKEPAYCLSSGRVLLAGVPEAELDAYLERLKPEKFTPHTVTSKVKLRSLIEEARRQGFSIVEEEYEIGLRSISVPVRDRAGRVIAALNVCCPSSRVPPADIRDRILPALAAAQRSVEDALGD